MITHEDLSTGVFFFRLLNSVGTHPVQAVDIVYQMGASEVTMICTFLQESLASGCLVVVQCAENFKQEVTISRGISVVAVSDIITGIPSGACDVLAYDVNEAGMVGNYMAANNSFEVVIMDVITQTPSASTGMLHMLGFVTLSCGISLIVG